MKKRSSLHSSRVVFFAASLLVGAAIAHPVNAQIPDDPKLEPFSHIKGAEKVSISLLRAAEAAKGGKSLADGLGTKAAASAPGAILIELVASDVTPALLASIAKTGATVVHSSERFDRISVSVDSAAAIEALAAIDGVRMIRPIAKPQVLGLAGGGTGISQGQGDRALRSDLLSTKYNTDGTGTRVGILSDSFASRFTQPTLIEDGVAESGSVAELSYGGSVGAQGASLPAGEYTLLVRTSDQGEITIAFTSDVVLTAPTPTPSFPCNLRVSLLGLTGTRQFNTQVVTPPIDQNFANPSCGAGNNYVLLGFTLASAASNFGVRATSSGNSEVSLSIRSGCANDASTEVDCVESQQRRGVSGMVNQLSGDLPSFVTIIRDGEATGFGQVSNEGAAMGELVHDIAPGADIGFHTALGGQAVFAEGILRLANFVFQPTDEPFLADVIVDDIIYFQEPVFQPGIVEQAISDVVASGVTYFSAAGNSANYGYRLNYQDVSGADDNNAIPNGNDLARWPGGDGYLPITVEPGATFTAVIQWNQPWDSLNDGRGSQIDFDAYVVTSKGTNGFSNALFSDKIERIGIDAQGTTGIPFGDPIEQVSYTNDQPSRQTVYLALNHRRGSKTTIPQINQPIEIRVIFPDVAAQDGEVFINNIQPENIATGGPTIWGHMGSPDVIAVGAVNWVDTPTFDTNFGPSRAIDPEVFSSTGDALTQYFDKDGFTLPVPSTIAKPEIAAVDGNNTTFFPGFENNDPSKPLENFDADEFPNFFGTSASAPNAAAVAALLISLNPDLRADDIKTIFAATAVDVTGVRAGVGFDAVSGAGLIDALAAADLVASAYGITTGAGSPSSKQFTFSGGAEGWTANSIPQFTAPGFRLGPDTLDITATNSFNTFGWLRSPEFLVSPRVVTTPDGALTVNGRTGAGSLMEAQVRISNSSNNPALAPTFRIRSTTGNSERSDVLVATSLGGGGFSPGGPASKIYRHYFPIPQSTTRFRLFVDLLGFDGEGPAGTTLRVDEVILIGFPSGTNTLTGARLEALRFFSNTNGGWTKRDASPLGTVHSSVGSDGIYLGPVSNAGVTSFGFWDSSSATPLATFERDRLYRLIFRVKSDIPTALKTSLPAFRLRANSANNQLSVYADINATTTTATIPTGGEGLDYSVFFVAPEELVGQTVNGALDYLYVPGIGKDGGQSIALQQIRLDSYQRPLEDALVP